MALDSAGRDLHVGVNKAQPFGRLRHRPRADPASLGFADPARRQRWTLEQRDLRMPRREFVDDDCGQICRMIIDHQHAQAADWIILRKQRFQARRDIGFLIAGRDDDGDTGVPDRRTAALFRVGAKGRAA
jgi:hypothetical protein